MIKLFRNFRQKLLYNNKFSKYLAYAAGEIVLVVVGILIALKINNQNENRKLDEIRQGYYHQILQDLSEDLIYFERRGTEYDSSIAKYNRYLKFVKTHSNPKPLELLRELGRQDDYLQFLSFHTNTIETLQATGDITLMPTDIRNKLMELKRSQDIWVLLAQIGYARFLEKREEVEGLGWNNEFIEAGYLEPNHELNNLFNFKQNIPQILLKMSAAYKNKNYLDKRIVRNFKAQKEYIKTLDSLINIELKE